MEKENKFKQAWNWLWNSDSIASFAVLLILIFIFIKLILFPTISLIFGTSLPLAIVESSSMDHTALQLMNPNYEICGASFPSKQFLNLDKYWQTCGSWYEQKNITKEQFSNFKFSNGFRKGDIMIIFGANKEKLKIGQVLIFQSKQPTPIIHRIVSLSPLQTKGDHNDRQIGITPDPRGIDETNIKQDQIIGVAVGKVPYLGLIKIYAIEHPFIFWPIIVIIILLSFYNPFSKK
jgi:hypothetical protein